MNHCEVSSLVISLVLLPQYNRVMYLASDDFPGLLTNGYKYMSHHIWAHCNESNTALPSPTHLLFYESSLLTQKRNILHDWKQLPFIYTSLGLPKE
jgi:hypothetical protein